MDTIYALPLVLFIIVFIYFIITKDKTQTKIRAEQMEELAEMREVAKQEENQREVTLSSYLNVPTKHLIVSESKEEKFFYEAKTNGKTFLVKFNKDYTIIEKIVETSISGTEHILKS